MLSPLVHRELLVQARYWGNYWLRVLVGVSGLAGLGILWLIETFKEEITAPAGFLTAMILGASHAGITAMLGVGGALLTADCLARERRDGTLGLLFLTPLTAREITLGKCAGQVLRLGSFWLAAIPFLTIPFLIGGVTPRNFLDALMIHITAGCTGLAAGLLATARCQQWRWAMIIAGAWLFGLYLALVFISSLALFGHLAVSTNMGIESDAFKTVPFLPLMIFAALPLEGPVSAGARGIPIAIVEAARFSLVALVVWSAAMLCIAVAWVFRILSRLRNPQAAPRPIVPNPEYVSEAKSSPNPVQKDAVECRRFRHACAPRGLMDRNPVHWLETSGTLPRLAPWILVGVVLVAWLAIGVGCLSVDNDWVYIGWALPTLLTLLGVVLAAASFRQEHEEGGLELILCTTLRPRLLVTGRLQAVAGFVLPAFAVSMVACLVFRGSSYVIYRQGGNPTFAVIPGHIYWGPAWALWGGAIGLAVALAWIGRRMPLGRRLDWGGWGAVSCLILVGILWALVGPDITIVRFYEAQRLNASSWISDTEPVWRDQRGYWLLLAIHLTSGTTAVCLAFRCAVRRVHPLMGCLIAVGVGVVLPYLVGALMASFASFANIGMTFPYPLWYEWLFLVIAWPIQAGLAVTSIWIAHRDLRTRQFQFRPFQRATT